MTTVSVWRTIHLSIFLLTVHCWSYNTDSLVCYHCVHYASRLSTAKSRCAIDGSNSYSTITCSQGSSCFIRSYEGEGSAIFQRSCGLPSCSSGCQGQMCTYCCDTDFCNADDSKLPTSSQLSPTEIMSIAGGAVISIIVILGIVTLVIRRRAYRRFNQHFRGSSDQYDDLDSDERELFSASERVRVGLPPTYNDTMEAPPPYDIKSDDGGIDGYDCPPPAFVAEGVQSGSDGYTGLSASTETVSTIRSESSAQPLD